MIIEMEVGEGVIDVIVRHALNMMVQAKTGAVPPSRVGETPRKVSIPQEVLRQHESLYSTPVRPYGLQGQRE